MKKYITSILKLPKSVKFFLITQVLIGIGAGVWNVNFNFFLASKGISMAQIGSISSVGSLATAVFALVAGHLSDRLGFKKSMLIGCIIKAIAMLVLPLANNNTELYSVSILNGVGDSFILVSQYPYITSLVDKKHKNTVYNLFFSTVMFSIFIGNIVASALNAYGRSIALGGLSVALAAICRSVLPDLKVEKKQRPKLYIPKDKLSRNYLLMEFFGYAGYFMANSMVNIILRDHMGYSGKVVGMVIGTMTLSGAVAVITPMLSDRFGVIKTNGVFMAILPFIYCGMAMLTRENYIFLAVTSTFLNCLSAAVLGGPVLHKIPDNKQGGFSGLMLLITNMGTSAGVFAAGRLVGGASGQSMLYFAVAALFVVVAGIFMFGLKKELKEG